MFYLFTPQLWCSLPKVQVNWCNWYPCIHHKLLNTQVHASCTYTSSYCNQSYSCISPFLAEHWYAELLVSPSSLALGDSGFQFNPIRLVLTRFHPFTHEMIVCAETVIPWRCWRRGKKVQLTDDVLTDTFSQNRRWGGWSKPSPMHRP